MWFVMLLGAVTACVAMNDIVMLMNMQKISRVYQSMEQTIYSAPRWLQMAGAGILVGVLTIYICKWCATGIGRLVNRFVRKKVQRNE